MSGTIDFRMSTAAWWRSSLVACLLTPLSCSSGVGCSPAEGTEIFIVVKRVCRLWGRELCEACRLRLLLRLLLLPLLLLRPLLPMPPLLLLFLLLLEARLPLLCSI